MILAVDIGNTNVNIGSFLEKRLISHLCISNKSLNQQKNTFCIKPSLLNCTKNILIASVNPEMESIFYKCLNKRSKKKVLTIGKEVKLKIPVLVDAPEKVGVDRLLNALAAYRRTKTSTIVVDFGTAITIDVVSKNGEFLGGLILPGVRMGAYSLYEQTAFLPKVDIKKPYKIIGKNTEDAISAGIYVGTAGAIIHILKEIRKEFKGVRNIIATGGDARMFKGTILQINNFIPHLTLEGIRTAFAESLNL